MSRKLKYEDIKNEFEKNNYKLVSEVYKNNQSKLDYICKKHPDLGIQKISISKLRMGYGCVCCRPKYKRNRRQLNNRTTQSFQNELDILFSENIILLSEYHKAREKVKLMCKKHNYIWFAYPYNLISGYGCPKCGAEASANKTFINRKDVIAEIESVNKNIKVLSKPEDLIAHHSKARCKCKICGHEWSTAYTNLTKKNSTGCPLCKHKEIIDKQRTSNESFVKKVKSFCPTVEVLEKYKQNNKEKIKCRCKIHPSEEWYQAPTTLYKGSTGCPRCQKHLTEDKMINILRSFGFDVVREKRYKDCKDIHSLPFDAYIEVENLLIEYNGEQHYKMIRRSKSETEDDVSKRLEIIRKHDEIKYNFCKNHNIKLIIVPYWERNNMEEFLLKKLKELNINIC